MMQCWCQPPGMPNCPHTLKNPGSFPRLTCLPSRDAWSGAQQQGWLQERTPRSHWAPRSAQHMHRAMMKCIHVGQTPRDTFLEGPYSSATDIKIISGTTRNHPLTGSCTPRHAESSLQLQDPAEEPVFGMPWICSWQGLEHSHAGRAESAFCHSSVTAMAWASQVLTTKST